MPIIVRPSEEGEYEMICVHRGMRTCTLAGINTIPTIVGEVDRDAAIITMVDSNF